MAHVLLQLLRHEREPGGGDRDDVGSQNCVLFVQRSAQSDRLGRLRSDYAREGAALFGLNQIIHEPGHDFIFRNDNVQ